MSSITNQGNHECKAERGTAFLDEPHTDEVPHTSISNENLMVGGGGGAEWREVGKCRGNIQTNCQDTLFSIDQRTKDPESDDQRGLYRR